MVNEDKIMDALAAMQQQMGEMKDHMSKMDERMSKMDDHMSKMDERMSKMDERMSKMDDHMSKMDEKIDRIDLRVTRTEMCIENYVRPAIELLTEGQKTILETLAPKNRVEELEDEVKFLKSFVYRMNEDMEKLKKAQ